MIDAADFRFCNGYNTEEDLSSCRWRQADDDNFGSRMSQFYSRQSKQKARSGLSEMSTLTHSTLLVLFRLIIPTSSTSRGSKS